MFSVEECLGEERSLNLWLFLKVEEYFRLQEGLDIALFSALVIRLYKESGDVMKAEIYRGTFKIKQEQQCP